ncbi:MAG: hypothetical protein R3B90_18840 [Planctomycetaceae bacterium]
MQCWKSVGFGGLMLTIGYILGTTGLFEPNPALAQSGEDSASVSPEAEDKIRAVNRALQEAMEQLRLDGKYTSITDVPNAFMILTGGGDALQDLESGNGVDPETFAAIYSGRILDEYAEMLDPEPDSEGRVTYQGKPIQVYSRARLKRLFAERSRIKDADL